ncbi:helveticin J family class III bacteriocin [Levilactobacillus brevis]|uniref:helveticin J family class III bacteriocin n=1 Tax=Levilactobacillus brevis TaxID=1580 RepID=UPI0031DC58CE
MAEFHDNDDEEESTPISEWVLDRSDFVSQEAADKYFRENPNAPRVAYEAGEATDSISVEVDRTENSATASAKYTLTDLPYGNVIQAIYVGTNFLYVDQTRNEAGGAIQLLSQYDIQGKPSGTLSNPKTMRLTRCGHNQSLQWDGGNFFWIGVKALSVSNQNWNTDGNKIDWSTQVGRVEFKAGTEIDYLQIPRISALNRANKNGSSIGTPFRSEVALSSNRKYLLIGSMNTKKDIQFAYYRLADLNSAMNQLVNASPKNIAADAPKIKGACVKSYSANRGTYTLPYGSLQGLEFADDYVIYINGDQEDDNCNGTHRPRISKKAWVTKEFEKGATYITTPSVPGRREAEGIQLKGDFVYMAVCYHPNPKTFTIVSIPKSSI